MDLADIEAELAEIDKRETFLSERIKNLLSEEQNLHKSFSSVSSVANELKGVDREVTTLHSKLEETSALSEKISKRVRHLDKVKCRVEAVIQRVEDILDLKNCTDGIKIALDNEDYEIAAGHIHRYRSLDTNFLKNNANESVSIEASIEILENAELQMQKVTRKKFEQAYSEQDAPSIERFFKIFPLIGLHNEGLSKFVSFLSSQVSSTTHKNLDMALQFVDRDDSSSVIFSDTFVLLFEGLARIIEIHQPLVETYYGPGWLTEFGFLLQEECDKQCNIIFKQFVEKRRIQDKLDQCRNIESDDVIVDIKHLDALLHETTLINERAELYLRFIKRRILADILLTCESDQDRVSRTEKIESALNSCGLSQTLHSLIGYYLQLETVFLQHSFKMAVQMNVVEEGSLTSSMVDDAFFVLKKSLRRSMSTTNHNAICAMINISNGLVENDYCRVLVDKLKTAIPTGYLDTMFTGRYQSDVIAQSRSVFLVSLNNCCLSVTYLKTLVESLTNDWKMLSASDAEESKNASRKRMESSNSKVMSCINDMQHLSKNIDAVLQEGHTALIKYFLKPLVKTCTENFSLISHNLTDDELLLNETEDPFSQKVIAPVDAFIGDIKESLLDHNFEMMISNLAQTLVTSFEKVIFKMKFSRNGGLAFDREVRNLSNYLSSVTQWSVRDKFTRLLQISTLLNLEQVEEVHELSINSSTWKVTPSEMRQILNLREDFKGDAIRKLVL